VPRRSPLPRLHVVTDDAVVSRPDLLAVAATVLRAGGGALALHLRAPRAGGRAMHDLAAALVPVAREAGALLIVNDRADVAASVDADGVQLPSRGIAAGDVRAIVGADRWIGSSVATGEQADAAVRGGADFLVAGSVFPTATHPGGEPIGIARLAMIARGPSPVVAIGGITVDCVEDVRRAGAYGIAVIRAVWDADDPAVAVAGLLAALGRSASTG
jgi:thiamine-phosphate pyrophosphorylase